MENQYYPIELEVLTPLCVGAGNENDWQPGADFVQYEGKVYVLNLQKMEEVGIDMNTLSSYFLNNDEQGIITLIGPNRLADVSDHVFPSLVSTTNPIKTFLRSQLHNRPLVAGSSIKGAIRSALFNYFSAEERERNLADFMEKDKDERGRKGKLNEYVFGKMNDGTDFMRFIRVGDVELSSTTLVNTKIFNLQWDNQYKEWVGGWKQDLHSTSHNYEPNKFNTLYECAPPKEKGQGTIVIDISGFDRILQDRRVHFIRYKFKKKNMMEGGLKALFHIINQVTKDYLLKEKAFFDKYFAENSLEIEDNIDDLLNMIPEDDSYCLLKMAVGVGFHAITGDWRFDDYDQTGLRYGAKKYKSRKIADYDNRLQLMGFFKLKKLETT